MAETNRPPWLNNLSAAAPFVISIVATVIIPLATTRIAGKFATASADREANVRMLEIAVGVLQQTPDRPGMPLRAWAVDVIDKYSTIPLPPAAQAQLRDSSALNLVTPYWRAFVRQFADTAGLPDTFR